jgi:hypothetical protein
MMTMSSRAVAVAFVSLVLGGAAVAQTPSTSTTTTPIAKSTGSEKKSDTPKSAASLECSKQADAKGLHGKERKKFRSECKRDESKDGKAK